MVEKTNEESSESSGTDEKPTVTEGDFKITF